MNKDETVLFPENRNYGCVDCGSINHTTGDATWCLVAQDAEYEANQETYLDSRCGCPDYYSECPLHGPKSWKKK